METYDCYIQHNAYIEYEKIVSGCFRVRGQDYLLYAKNFQSTLLKAKETCGDLLDLSEHQKGVMFLNKARFPPEYLKDILAITNVSYHFAAIVQAINSQHVVQQFCGSFGKNFPVFYKEENLLEYPTDDENDEKLRCDVMR